MELPLLQNLDLGKPFKLFNLMKRRVSLSDQSRIRFKFNIRGVNLQSSDKIMQERRLVVLSNGKRQAVHRFLWLKYLWDSLSKLETILFFLMPESLKSAKISSVLRLRNEGKNLKVLRARVNKLEQLLNEKESTRNSYQGMRRMRIEIREEIRSLRPTKKFSGYVKTPSSVGSKRKSGGSINEPLFSSDFKTKESFAWYETLKAGKLQLLSGEVITDLDD